MEVTIQDLPEVGPNKNPLLVQAQFVSQLAGSGVFFQVVSSLSENPVRVILHDRISGKRKLLIIEAAMKMEKVAAAPVQQAEPKGSVKMVTLYQGDPLAPPKATPMKEKIVPVAPKPVPEQVLPQVTPPPVGLKVPAAPKIPQIVQLSPPPTTAVSPTVADAKPRSPSLKPPVKK